MADDVDLHEQVRKLWWPQVRQDILMLSLSVVVLIVAFTGTAADG